MHSPIDGPLGQFCPFKATILRVVLDLSIQVSQCVLSIPKHAKRTGEAKKSLCPLGFTICRDTDTTTNKCCKDTTEKGDRTGQHRRDFILSSRRCEGLITV